MSAEERNRDLCAALFERAGDELEIIRLRAGETLFRQGDPADAVYAVRTGRVSVTLTGADEVERLVAEVGPDGVVGELGLMAGRVRSARVSALEDSQLLKLPGTTFERIVENSPEVLEQMTDVVRSRLRRTRLAKILTDLLGDFDADVLREVEASGHWVDLSKGDALFHQGEAGENLYVLVTGRLRVVAEGADGTIRTLNEMVPGETVGEMSMITGEPHSATVYAIRQSSLLRLSRSTWERIGRRHPELLLAIARLLVQRLRTSEGTRSAVRPATTVALIAAGDDAPLHLMAERLVAGLSSFGDTLHLDAQRFNEHLGIQGAANLPLRGPRSSRLAAWLDEQETICRFIVLEADPGATTWTRRCVEEADHVLLIADATGDPGPAPVEKQLLEDRQPFASARRTLVLLHPDGGDLPSGTARWLRARRVDAHYHVRRDAGADFGRLARYLAGRSLGLVLGGGGARGLAHVGVIRALREAGVPIDLIAGTSMGAVIGGLAAMGRDYDAILEMGRQVFVDGKPHKEYTLPIISIIRSRRLDRLVKMVYCDADIEDLWRPFFCISCNLTTTEMVVHTTGKLWKAVRASSSLPGVFVPVLEGRNLLVDGGVLNNMPGDVMRRFSCGPVIAVEVSPESELAFDNPEFPSPWQLVWDRVSPTTDRVKVPNILAIMMRTIVVGSEQKSREVKMDADLCLHPPVDSYGLLEFEPLADIARVGYEHTKSRLEELKNEAWLQELIRSNTL
jgi:NTE family protein/lysophospholipid hydrolase